MITEDFLYQPEVGGESFVIRVTAENVEDLARVKALAILNAKKGITGLQVERSGELIPFKDSRKVG